MKSSSEIVRFLDQTNLRPQATTLEMVEFIKDAKENNYFAVACMPIWVPMAADILKGSNTRIVAAIGFPLGTGLTTDKVAEVEWVLEKCKDKCEVDIDMVMNISLLKSNRYKEFRNDIEEVVRASCGKTVKVIIEVGMLTQQEIVIASLMAEVAGADFVKTSTGFKNFAKWRPSTVDDVCFIKNIIKDDMQVKIAGGVRTYEESIVVINAGATRIGTSSGKAIKDGYKHAKHLREKNVLMFL